MSENFVLKEIFKGEDWNLTSIFSETPFTQSFEYGNWQKASGKKVRRFIVLADGAPVCFFQIIFFSLTSSKTYGYIPYGPVANSFAPDLLEFLQENILKISKEEKAIFTRLDFTPDVRREDISDIFHKPRFYSYLGAYFQPRYEWILPLAPSAESLLANMHQKARYSVRLAEKKGVSVEIVTKDFEKYLPDFLELMQTTSSRNNFSLHEKDYYENIFKLSQDSKNVFLAVASLAGKILVIDFIFIYGDTAMYVFGGSSNESRNISAPHLAKWKAIEHAKNLGLRFYNFGGIEDPERKLYKDWEGLTEFKKKFGGEVLKHSDFYDVVAEPFWYFLYNVRKLVNKCIK